jgi:hypothetical protein
MDRIASYVAAPAFALAALAQARPTHISQQKPLVRPFANLGT